MIIQSRKCVEINIYNNIPRSLSKSKSKLCNFTLSILKKKRTQNRPCHQFINIKPETA